MKTITRVAILTFVGLLSFSAADAHERTQHALMKRQHIHRGVDYQALHSFGYAQPQQGVSGAGGYEFDERNSVRFPPS